MTSRLLTTTLLIASALAAPAADCERRATGTASATSAPTSTSSVGNAAQRSLSLDSTFIVELDNTPLAAPVVTTKSGLKLNKSVYIVDNAGTTKEQIDKYHAEGKTVICYFSAGTWEPWRPDALEFKPQCYCGAGKTAKADGRCNGNANKMSDWDEWWLDIHSAECKANVKQVQEKRMMAAFAKGCDGVDPDNVDSFTNTDEQKHGNTAQDQVDYLLWMSSVAHGAGKLIDLKNAGSLLVDDNTGKATKYQKDLVAAFDFNVIEECNRYKECDTYDSFLVAGKPQIQLEYSNKIKKCPKLRKGQNLLVLSGTNLDTRTITLDCQG